MNLYYEFNLKEEAKEDYVETIGKDIDDDATAKILRWKRALDQGTTDPMFQDIEAMERFHMTWDELMALPERVYRSMDRIYGLKAKHAMKQQQAAQYGNEW